MQYLGSSLRGVEVQHLIELVRHPRIFQMRMLRHWMPQGRRRGPPSDLKVVVLAHLQVPQTHPSVTVKKGAANLRWKPKEMLLENRARVPKLVSTRRAKRARKERKVRRARRAKRERRVVRVMDLKMTLMEN